LKCHPSASAGFAEILAHGTPDDRQAYPQLYWLDRGITWALLALLSAMSVHSLLWLVRGLWELRWTGRSPEHGLAAVAQQDGEAPVPGRDWLRFPALERFAHGLVAVSFFLLTLTGMPLKFRDADWAKALFSSMGGVPVAGGLHRLGAALLLIGLGLHVLDSLRRIRRYRRECRDASGRLDGVRLRQRLWGPDSIWPQRSDWRDLRLHLRWFVRGGSKPGFDRFAYWEKFHHLVVALSLVILLLTGILLWFPQTLTKLVPGWLINVAQVVHSDQALLMAGLVLVFHAFHVALRPDRFPLNPAMFTGQVTEEQLRVERPRHYARLVANGDLESSLAGYSWQDWRPILASLGLVALIIGLLLAVAIFAGLGQILLG
jgi:cytochrome b subunit of formate dehydrogenase